MKSFLICPVRGMSPDAHKTTVDALEAQGFSVHWPPRDTDQTDEVGLRICRDNAAAIAAADVVHVIWDGKSQGCLFDLGVAFALGKKLEVILIPALSEGKSFQNMMAAWSCEVMHGVAQPEKVRLATIDECANLLAREYPDNANTNAFCAAIRSLASQPPAAPVDLTNHHNALKCPYCNPKGLQFAEPNATTVAALKEAEQLRCSAGTATADDLRAVYDAWCVDNSKDAKWMSPTARMIRAILGRYDVMPKGSAGGPQTLNKTEADHG